MTAPTESKQPKPSAPNEEDVLRRMLNTPPKPHPQKPAPAKPEKAK